MQGGERERRAHPGRGDPEKAPAKTPPPSEAPSEPEASGPAPPRDRGKAVSLDANNAIYQAIRDYKERELQKQLEVLRDAQSITDTMVRKRREADENRSVVTASHSYANNARYVDINSGNDPRIRLSRGVHPLNPDECDVYTSLLDAAPGSSIAPAMNHHITADGEIEGFRFTCSGADVASVMPIGRRMFFLTSMVECQRPDDDEDATSSSSSASSASSPCASSLAEHAKAHRAPPSTAGSSISTRMKRAEKRAARAAVELESVINEHGGAGKIGYVTAAMMIGFMESDRASSAARSVVSTPYAQASYQASARPRGSGGGESKAILGLLVRQREVRDRLVRLVQGIHRSSSGKEASFSCMADNADIIHAGNSGGSASVDAVELFGTMHNRRVADSCEWEPEMPERVGIYHAYVRGLNRDKRTHRLFIVVTGGCTSMSDNYFNLFLDVRNHMKVEGVANSEETWFLRNASKRSNARVAMAVAREFDLQVPTRAPRFFSMPTQKKSRNARRPSDASPGEAGAHARPDVSPTRGVLLTHPRARKVPTIVDTYDCSRRKVASCDAETFHYDLRGGPDGSYSVFSSSMDPTTCTNGVLFSMHAGEGTWIFKGPPNTSSAMCSYGGPFGHGMGRDGAPFPVCTARINDNYSWRSRAVPGSAVARGAPCTVQSPTTPAGVAVLDQNGEVVARGSKAGSLPAQETHTYVDESYLVSLRESCGWSRDNGIIELIPIAVVERRYT